MINENEENQTSNSDDNVRSVIDEYIKIEKNKKNKQQCQKGIQINTVEVPSLAVHCANKIYKKYYYLLEKLKRRRKFAWHLLYRRILTEQNSSKCKDYIRFIDKRLDWLSMFGKGAGSLRILKETYTDTNIFYREKYNEISVSEDVLEISDKIKMGLKAMLNKH